MSKYSTRTWDTTAKTLADKQADGYLCMGTSVGVDAQLTSTDGMLVGYSIRFGAGAVTDTVVFTDSGATAAGNRASVQAQSASVHQVDFVPAIPMKIKYGLYIGITTASSTAVTVNVAYK